jgi:NADH-quinone oxidoreductase subunit E
VTNAELDELIDDLQAGKLTNEIPPHGTLGRQRQHIPAGKGFGVEAPEDVTTAPAWLPIKVEESK